MSTKKQEVEVALVSKEKKEGEETSSLPIIFYSIGFIVLFGGIFGGYQAGAPKYSFLGSPNWDLIWIIWVSSGISSMFFFGFGKIIDLLVRICNLLQFQNT